MDMGNVEMKAVTLDDCITLYETKGIATVLADGNVVAFVEEH